MVSHAVFEGVTNDVAVPTTARRFLDGGAHPGVRTCVVTYDTDPREDPAALAAPRAVVMNGQRIR
jgi:hypothetical protein